MYTHIHIDRGILHVCVYIYGYYLDNGKTMDNEMEAGVLEGLIRSYYTLNPKL